MNNRTLNKSKYQFSQTENDYCLKDYDCEICGQTYNFYEMSSCERYERFICDKCSEAVCNRNYNSHKYDFFVANV